MDFGYIRVSSHTQNGERQLAGVDLDRTIIEKQSGKSTSDRPELVRLIDFVHEGDTVHVHSIDRLARNLRDLQDIIKTIVKNGAAVKFHKENLTFNGDDTPMSNLMLQMIGAVAEFERALIRERQAEGIAAAKQRGQRFGQPPKITSAQVDEVIMLVGKGLTKAEIAKRFDVSRQTIYNVLSRSMSKQEVCND